jgi:hypothetical protein
VKAVTQNEFDQQAIRLWREANAYPNIAFPLWAEVEIEDRKQEVLLLAERVKGGDRSDPPIVFEASTDRGSEGIAEFGVGGKLKALVRVFPFKLRSNTGLNEAYQGPHCLSRIGRISTVQVSVENARC